MFLMSSHSKSMLNITHILLTPLLILRPFREADAAEMQKGRLKRHFRRSIGHCKRVYVAVDCGLSLERTRAFLTQGRGRLKQGDLRKYFLDFACV